MSFLNVKCKGSNHFITIRKDRDLTLDFEDYTLKIHDTIGWLNFEKEDFLDICNYLGVKNPHNKLFTRVWYKAKHKYKPLHEFEWGDNSEEYGFSLKEKLEYKDINFNISPEYVVHTINLIGVNDYYGIMITHLPSGLIHFNSQKENIEDSFRRCFYGLNRKIKELANDFDEGNGL